MNNKSLRQARIIFIIGVILLIAAPFLFTRIGFIDFTNTGQIGDTIGGVTAPIANLLGSLLIFYALQAQIDANRIVQEQIAKQTDTDSKKKAMQNLMDQFKILREDINEFEYITAVEYFEGSTNKTTYLTRIGYDAFRQVIVGMKHFKSDNHGSIFEVNPKLLEVRSILIVIDNFTDKLQTTDIENGDREFLKNLISYQFNSKVKHCFDGMEEFRVSKHRPCEKCGQIHSGVPDEFFKIINSLNSKLA